MFIPFFIPPTTSPPSTASHSAWSSGFYNNGYNSLLSSQTAELKAMLSSENLSPNNTHFTKQTAQLDVVCPPRTIPVAVTPPAAMMNYFCLRNNGPNCAYGFTNADLYNVSPA